MKPVELLETLRNNVVPSATAIRGFIEQFAQNHVSDAQAGAFLMGLCRTKLDTAARLALTLAMRDSGETLRWDLPAPVLDKHSTGGVGDATSLLLAPMLAACGVYVPMISGRGLGHTGGTLDKLCAIPGVQTTVARKKFQSIVAKVGCAIVAPTPDIAPADKRLYAMRDVTGTVRSIDLITSSILSKKLAAGLEGLVLDIKIGTGAVMENKAQAQELAQALVQTANSAGCPTTALMTDMNQPLLPSCGNGVEIADVMRAFESGHGRAVQLAVALGAELLCQNNVFETHEKARTALRDTVQSGEALARFGQMIAAQSGPRNFAERWQDYLTIAPAHPALATSCGYVSEIDGRALGNLVACLGGGRLQESDQIDPSVGLSNIVSIGDYVSVGHPLATIHTKDESNAQNAIKTLQNAITLASEEPIAPPLIYERIAP